MNRDIERAATAQPATNWSTHQLSGFLLAVASCEDEPSAIAAAVQWAAEAVEAEVAAAVAADGTVRGALGFPRGEAPQEQLAAIATGATQLVDVPGLGLLPAVSVVAEGLDGGIVLARSGDPFSAEEIGLLRAMARTLALTLRNIGQLERERALREDGERRAQENMRLLLLLQERQKFLERLSKIQLSISHHSPLPNVLDTVVAGAHELIGDEVIALRLVDRENQSYMNIVSSIGVSRAMLASTSRVHVSQGAGGRAISEDQLVTIEDYAHAAGAIAEYADAALQSAMAAPIHEDGRATGSIVVASYRRGRTYSTMEREMLITFAHHASLALNDAKAAEEMRHLAYHDGLTRLPNRALFVENLERALANAQRTQAHLAVIFLDLDRFKLVNDSLGHSVGDRLLTAVGERLRESIRTADLAARLGGDEFAILAENTTQEGAAKLAEILAESLRTPFDIDGHELVISASLGVAVDHGGKSDAGSLLRNADLAMYRAKFERPGHHAIYEPSMHVLVSDRVQLETGLRRAVANAEFTVDYQPIVWLASGRVAGMEALVRWHREDGTAVSPMEFIPIAEEMGLVSPIGRFVLRTAMQQMADWQRANLLNGQVELSVNLSPHQLYRPELVDDIVDSLFTTGFDPRQLTLELTETALMHDTNAVRQRLLELREFGIRIALDDFGTGYSSLSYLRHFPIDVLKIDKSFIGAIGSGSDGASLSKAIIDLGRTLNITTIAEGVESSDQAAELLRLQCRLGQGYYFSRPLPGPAMERYLTDIRASHGDPVTLTAIDSAAIAM